MVQTELLQQFLTEIKEAAENNRRIIIFRITEESDCNAKIVLDRVVWHENKSCLYLRGTDDFELSINIDSVSYEEIDNSWELVATKEKTSIVIMGRKNN